MLMECCRGMFTNNVNAVRRMSKDGPVFQKQMIDPEKDRILLKYQTQKEKFLRVYVSPIPSATSICLSLSVYFIQVTKPGQELQGYLHDSSFKHQY